MFKAPLSNLPYPVAALTPHEDLLHPVIDLAIQYSAGEPVSRHRLLSPVSVDKPIKPPIKIPVPYATVNRPRQNSTCFGLKPRGVIENELLKSAPSHSPATNMSDNTIQTFGRKRYQAAKMRKNKSTASIPGKIHVCLVVVLVLKHKDTIAPYDRPASSPIDDAVM